MNKNIQKISKFLSLLLRHKPEKIGLELDENGWAKIADLIRLTESQRSPLTKPIIMEAVETNDKKRFSISSDGLRIRANQGHSISVELHLEIVQPPPNLYHGTASRFLESIIKEGLLKQNRQHVHLAGDIDTASKVGIRHGKLTLLKVDALEMYTAGNIFYRSKNGVWLTDNVPFKYIKKISPKT